MITVHIENYYEDGYISEHEVVLPEPEPGETLEEWFESEVYQHTGDATHCAINVGSCYTATIIDTDDVDLLGLYHEWTD